MATKGSLNGSEKSSEASGEGPSSAKRTLSLGLGRKPQGGKVLERVIEQVDKSQTLNRLGQGLTGLTGKVIKPG